ncbi:MAG TPA: ParB/RepB/Spo0J family partition protein [Marinobacterium sp.]|nr:ParB/RepB/Spo0J family partition protein [Marinobacterium sp.]
MVAKKRGLKRGLDVLLSGIDSESLQEVSTGRDQAFAGLTEIPVDQICRGRYQPRREIESAALEDLANSIRAQGLMQPIVIRPAEVGYEIIAGERRWRAAQMAGLTSIPAVIRDVPDEAAIAMALIENIQREDLNPIEEAIALQRLQKEFDLSQQEVAQAVGKSRSAVANLLRLLNLCDEVKTYLERGDIEMGHARALLPLASELQVEAGREVVAKNLSVRDTEALARRLQESVPTKSTELQPNTHLSEISERLSKLLAAKVTLSANAKGRGKITINYKDPGELESILERLQR